MNRTFAIAFGGGRDEVTPSQRIPPGRTIADVNHEQVDGGYARIGGFERFDGQTLSSEYPYYILEFTGGSTAIEAGDTITGGTSGATGVVLLDAELDSGAWDGTGAGTLGFRDLTGDFVDGEDLEVSGSAVAVASGAQQLGANDSSETAEAAWAAATIAYQRTQIGTVPGQGAIRGIWRFDDVVYVWRNNVGLTACDIHKSTAAGWVKVELGKSLAFTSGGTTEIQEGDTITGATSGATATVERIARTGGSWAAGDASGSLTLSGQTGTFQAEDLDVGASSNVATIAGDSAQITLSTGGRYFFLTHNFYGSSGTQRIYGCCDGAQAGGNKAFEFDGEVLTPIRTGAVDDRPIRIGIQRNHLVLAQMNGNIDISATGDPLNFESSLGAVTLGVGSDITDLVSNNMDSLAILAERSISMLTGSSSADFALTVLTDEAGALEFTGQFIGGVVYMDNRGLRSIRATEAYGNFAMGVLSRAIQRTMNAKKASGISLNSSVIVRSKNQYRIFYNDGTGISFYFGMDSQGREFVAPMAFDLGKVVQSICSQEGSDQTEHIYFGSSDGYVYRLDSGTSFDGEDIQAFIQLPYAHMGDPRVLKRAHKVVVDLIVPPSVELGIAMEYDYSSDEQQETFQRTSETKGGGGLWDVADWDSFYWSAPINGALETHVEGQGNNMSLIIYSESSVLSSYTLQGATIDYSVRGRAR